MEKKEKKIPGRRSSGGGISTGAAFMAALVSVGPSLLVLIANFTAQFGGVLFWVLLAAALVIITAEKAIWELTAGTGQYFQDILEQMRPGLGRAAGVIIAACGFIFNLGNTAGMDVGIRTLTGLPKGAGLLIGTSAAALLLLLGNASGLLNIVSQVSGTALLLILLGIVIHTGVPAERLTADFAILPDVSSLYYPALSLIGSGIGGYSVFVGAHSLIDQGTCGPPYRRDVSRCAVLGAAAGTVLRLLLFAAVLAVLAAGLLSGSEENVLAAVFRKALPGFGRLAYGLIMTISSLSCTVFCTYSSIGFLLPNKRGPGIGSGSGGTVPAGLLRSKRGHAAAQLAFLLVTAGITLIFGKPVRILMVVGAAVGLSIPLILLVPVVAALRFPGVTGQRPFYTKRFFVLLLAVFAVDIWITIGAVVTMIA